MALAAEVSMMDWFKRNRHLLVAVFVLLVFIAWGALWVVTREAYWTESQPKFERHGQFGDAFGSLNALFTGLGLVGLVYTLILM
jgi:hypothetical protein